MIDRETLESRKAELQAQYDRCIADANAAAGGLQTLDWVIAELDAPQDEHEQNPVETGE